jgi:hypothetical protein
MKNLINKTMGAAILAERLIGGHSWDEFRVQFNPSLTKPGLP